MYRVNRMNKFGAMSSEYDGVRYHSKLEAAYAQILDTRKACGDIRDWRRQVKVALDVNGFHICNYYVDFEVTHNDGSVELVEIKGFETPLWRLKWKLLEAIYAVDHPEITLTVLK